MTEDYQEVQPNSSMTDPLEMPENINTMEPLDCFTSSTSPLTSRIVLIKRFDYLWNMSYDSRNSTTLVQILKDHPDLLETSLNCILPYLKKKIIFARILQKVKNE